MRTPPVISQDLLRLFCSVSTALAEAPDRERLLRVLVESLPTVCAADAAVVLLPERDGGLAIAAARGTVEAQVGAGVAPEEINQPPTVRALLQAHARDEALTIRLGSAAEQGYVLLRRRESAETPLHSDQMILLETLAGQAGSALEVAERRKAERAAAARYEKLFEGAPDGLLAIDRNGRVTLFNPAAERLFGYSHSDLIGESFEYLIPERYRVDHRDHFARYLLDPEARVMGPGLELCGLRKDGSEFPIEVSLSPQEPTDGFVVATIRDVTEVRAAERELRRSEELLRTVLETLPVGVWIVDETGRIVQANLASRAIWGGARYVGMHEYDQYRAWRPDTGQPIQPEEWGAARAVRQGETTLDEVIEIEAFDGVRKTILVSASPILGRSGQISGAVVVNEDITAYRRTQRALEESERFNRAIFDSLPAEIAVIDGKGVIRAVNQSWEQFARANGGAPGRTGVGVNYLDVCRSATGPYSENADLVAEGVERVLEGTSALFESEYACPTPSGDLYFLLRASPLATPERGVALSHIDITELKQVEAALRESEERFRLSMEYAAIGKGLVSPQGKWLRVNRALTELLGYSEAELLATDFQTITHPDDLAADLDHLRRLLAGEIRAYRAVKRYLRKDGRIVWVELSVTLVRDASDRPLYFISQVQDITERKRYEEELARTNALLRAVLDSAQYAIVSTDRGGTILFFNRGAEVLLGYEAAELVGKAPIEVLLDPEEVEQRAVALLGESGRSREARFEAVIRAAQSGVHIDTEWTYRRSNGTTVPVDLSITPLRDERGEVSGILTIARDISERRVTAAQLQQQAELIERAHDAIIVRGFDGTITFWNHGAERTYGYTKEEAIGRVSHVLLRAQFPETPDAVNAVLLRDAFWEGELIHTTRSSERIVVTSRQVLQRGEPGRPGAVLEVNRDITQRKQAEEARDRLLISERHKSEQLQLAIREAHHRIKNNLQAVVDLLSLELSSQDSPAAALALRDSTQRVQAIALVHDLLSQDQDVEVVNMRHLCGRLVPEVLLGCGISPRQVQVNLDVADLTLPSRKATALALVLNELVTNAAKHAFHQRPGQLSIRLHPTADRLAFVVADDGPGLLPEFDFGRDAHVGLQVIRTLVENTLEGEMNLSKGPGLRAELSLPR